MRRTVWSICLCVAAWSAAGAELSKEEIIGQLQPRQVRTRGIGPTRAITVEPSNPDAALRQKANLPSINMRVPFDFDSAVLTRDGQSALKALGEALNDTRLETSSFLIGGHTDARGSEAYNQALSERRAQAVREHLTSAYRVSPDRLKAIGFGKRELVDRKNPESGVNRRVEIVNLSQ